MEHLRVSFVHLAVRDLREQHTLTQLNHTRIGHEDAGRITPELTLDRAGRLRKPCGGDIRPTTREGANFHRLVAALALGAVEAGNHTRSRAMLCNALAADLVVVTTTSGEAEQLCGITERNSEIPRDDHTHEILTCTDQEIVVVRELMEPTASPHDQISEPALIEFQLPTDLHQRLDDERDHVSDLKILRVLVTLTTHPPQIRIGYSVGQLARVRQNVESEDPQCGLFDVTVEARTARGYDHVDDVAGCGQTIGVRLNRPDVLCRRNRRPTVLTRNRSHALPLSSHHLRSRRIRTSVLIS